MASTAEASRLTQAHRLAQARLGVNVVRQMLATWRLLDLDDLDATLERWLSVNLPLITGQRAASARMAANYLALFRQLEIGTAEGFVPVLAETVPEAKLATSLTVTGPLHVKRALTTGLLPDQAARTAQVSAARAAMRHVLDGGRDTIIDSVSADREALGWARVTSGRACAFCAMLASRGPVYREATVGFRAHDGCACSAEPVYDRDAAWPAGAAQYRALWNEATRGLSGADARNAFRRALAAS